MVAYSFKRQFVRPIRIGLGLLPAEPEIIDGPMPQAYEIVMPHPKRQTIRGERRRHARPGENLQLYCGMRTKGCFLIGNARCLSVYQIRLWVGLDYLALGSTGQGITDEFAQADGFADAKAMHEFWRKNNSPGPLSGGWWRGVLIKWEPLP
jgi:hypothetical protein